MGQQLKIGAINQVQKNSVIYAEGGSLNSIALILKGNVVSTNAGFRMAQGPGEFIALNDLYIGAYSCTTVAYTDCSIYLFEAKGIEDIRAILDVKQEYRGYLIKSLNRLLANMYEVYYSILGVANDTLMASKGILEDYRSIVSSYGGEPEKVYGLEALEAYEKGLPMKEEWIQMVKELLRVPVEVVASYYSYIPATALREIEEKIKISTIVMKQLKMLPSYVGKVSAGLISEGNDGLFKAMCRTMLTLSRSHVNYAEMVELVDRAVELVNGLESALEEQYGQASLVKRAQMEKLYYSIISGEGTEMEMAGQGENAEDIRRILENSLEQILSFGEIEYEIREQYISLMGQFAALRNKSSVDEPVRELRRKLTSIFFYIYKKVFMKAYKSGEYGKAVELFLHFGYMDERLLANGQLESIYRLRVKNTLTHYCNCYTMYDWFVEIYEGRKEPSKNDMDLDYRDYIRQMSGKGKLTPAEERAYMEDYEAKLDYELSNMFQHNMKIANGKISTYVPFLYEENMPLNIDKYFVTPLKVDEALRDILKVDFSAFYREIMYMNPEAGIQKELIMKECLPDVILFPTCGMNGIMWQETAGKSRDSAARFCLPILFETNLSDTMIRLVARFRWELCRMVQGLSWNDIKNKCLTSEYNDYIQFYRKNRELSEDKKEKVKSQIQKARSNTRECFVMDYEQWLKYEIGGSIRLNKCARDILAHYCPFAKEYREKLSDRQQYAEGFAKYEKEAKAKGRILDAKILGIRKNNFEVPKEIELTAAFYNNR